MNEDDTFEIWIKKKFSDDKSIWWELNIDFTTTTWQQKIKATATKANKFSIDVKRNALDLKDRSFEQ